MEAVRNIESKKMSEVLESCLETVKEGWERTLAGALKWSLHPTEQDSVSELSRAELVFFMLLHSLSSLDAEISPILLKEVERWTLFPRITKYMAGKMKEEWNIPKEIVDRAAKFAVILERSGMFTVPQELHRYLAELLAADEQQERLEENSHEGAAGRSSEVSPFHEQSKRARKDPRKSAPSQQDEFSVGEQAAGGEHQQVRQGRLVARRRRTHRQPGRGQEKRGKQSLQVQTSPPHMMKPISGASKMPSQASKTEPLRGGEKPLGAIPKAPQPRSTAPPQPANKIPTGAIPKTRNSESATSPKKVEVSFGAQAKASKSHSACPDAVDIPTRGATRQTFSSSCQTEDCLPPRSPQSTSSSCQTEECPPPILPQKTSSSCQTEVCRPPTLPRVSRAEAREMLWRGVQADERGLVELAVHCGARLEEKREGLTPLLQAATDGRKQAVRALLAAGARLEERDDFEEETALHKASKEGHLAIVRALLDAGARVGAEGGHRQTPLHWASFGGHMAVVRELVEAGAELNTRASINNTTPLRMAMIGRRNAVKSYLRSVGARL